MAKLNEAAADGWDVVSIVPTGGDVSAFLRREGSTSEDEIAAEDGMVAAVMAEEAARRRLAEEAVLDEELAEEAVLDEELADDAAAQEWSAGDTAALAVLADGEAGASADAETTAAEVVETVEVTEVPSAEEAAVEEPAGWAVAPESPADTAEDTADEIPVVAAAAVIEPVAEPVPVETEPVAEPSPASGSRARSGPAARAHAGRQHTSRLVPRSVHALRAALLGRHAVDRARGPAGPAVH